MSHFFVVAVVCCDDWGVCVCVTQLVIFTEGHALVVVLAHGTFWSSYSLMWCLLGAVYFDTSDIGILQITYSYVSLRLSKQEVMIRICGQVGE